MEGKIREIVRDRRLTDEEAARYREIRALVARELPELRARAKRRLDELREVTEVFAELKRVREARGLSLGDMERLTGIDRSALSKLERGQRVNFTMDTVTRYAAAVGKHVLFQLADT
ncbi:MAG: helix-turn-helix transcriptional regulator [Thermoguttaceae bacterium]|jgi:DNA-binding XRE family transcriptional regulator